MTDKQVAWAMTHDWYYYTATSSVNGVRTVWCHSNRLEGGIVPFQDFDKLKAWAGY